MTDKQIICGRGSAKIYTTLNIIEVMLENEKLKETLTTKEQECEELNKTITNLENIRDEFSAKLNQLKTEKDELKKDLDFQKNMYECARADEEDKFEEILELKQTLAEIKEIAESCGWNFGSEILYKRIEYILQKISECERS